MRRSSRVVWVLVGLALVVGGFILAGQPTATAAPPNQTIPNPTVTAPATPLPTVTPTSPSGPADTPVPPTNTPAPVNPTATATSQPGAPAATNTPTATPLPTNTPTAAASPTAAPAFALQGQMSVVSGLALQGQEVVLRLVIANPGAEAAQNVTVRDELPRQLQLVAAEATGGATATQVTGDGRTILLLTWPSLAPGSEAHATLTVRIAPDVADGVVLDNLAVAYADNAGPVTVGVSIGTPPVLLPTFD